jgi:hypothetical protein
MHRPSVGRWPQSPTREKSVSFFVSGTLFFLSRYLKIVNVSAVFKTPSVFSRNFFSSIMTHYSASYYSFCSSSCLLLLVMTVKRSVKSSFRFHPRVNIRSVIFIFLFLVRGSASLENLAETLAEALRGLAGARKSGWA